MCVLFSKNTWQRSRDKSKHDHATNHQQIRKNPLNSSPSTLIAIPDRSNSRDDEVHGVDVFVPGAHLFDLFIVEPAVSVTIGETATDNDEKTAENVCEKEESDGANEQSFCTRRHFEFFFEMGSQVFLVFEDFEYFYKAH